MTVGYVVLAAGRGRRFGGQKLRAELHGRSLISRALDAVPAGAPACVVAGEPEIMAMARARGMAAVCNTCPAEGISRSIRLGIEALPEADALCFLVADQPLLSRRSVAHLADVWAQMPEKIVRAAHGATPGNPCIFPRRFFAELLTLREDRGGSAVIRAHPESVQCVQLPAHELLDCDTPEALALLSGKEEAQ